MKTLFEFLYKNHIHKTSTVSGKTKITHDDIVNLPVEDIILEDNIIITMHSNNHPDDVRAQIKFDKRTENNYDNIPYADLHNIFTKLSNIISELKLHNFIFIFTYPYKDAATCFFTIYTNKTCIGYLHYIFDTLSFTLEVNGSDKVNLFNKLDEIKKYINLYNK